MAESKHKTMKVVMGPSLWGYEQGQEVYLDAEVAQALIDGGHAYPAGTEVSQPAQG